MKEEKKSLYRPDILIDDYIGNVKEYLTNTTGTAILVNQPWNNSGRDEMEEWIPQHRLYIVMDIREAVAIVMKLRKERRQA